MNLYETTQFILILSIYLIGLPSFVYGALDEIFGDGTIGFLNNSFNDTKDLRFFFRWLVLIFVYYIKFFNLLGSYTIKIIKLLCFKRRNRC